MDNYNNSNFNDEVVSEFGVRTENRPNYYYSNGGNSNNKKGMQGWVKAIIIIGVIIIGLMILGRSCSKMAESLDFAYRAENVKVSDIKSDYIGVLHVETTITEKGESAAYNHKYILDSIDDMINDEKNKGIIFYLNTPGGSVYASDELYFKILEYKERTNRPVYSSMQSMAASGGYYISAPCDKIYANRNCWTGSIGVTIGTLYDASGLLEKLGVKTQTITSGKNKAMGSQTDKLTTEQRKIFQSLVDESYEQFVEIVAEGRNIPIKKVKEIADGRIYTAKQAKKIKLIDKIGTFEDAVADMKATYMLKDSCEAVDFVKENELGFLSSLGIKVQDNSLYGMLSDVKEVMGLDGKFQVSYEAQIKQ